MLAAGLFAHLEWGPAAVDHVVDAAGLTAMGLVALCVIHVLFSAWLARRALRRADSGLPAELETLTSVRTSLRLPSPRAWSLMDVRLEWESPSTVAVELEPAGRWLAERITPSERGRHDAIVRRYTVGDVLGLAAISLHLRRPQPLVIVSQRAHSAAALRPSLGMSGELSHPSGRAEGDFIEMRRFSPGDPLRHVLWKTFARTRRLLVRTPERAVAPQPTTVAFLVAGEGDEASCALARLYLELGRFGLDFRFAADGATRPTERLEEALAQIVDSVTCRDVGGRDLEVLAAQIEPSRLASCLLFAPAVDGPWRHRLLTFAHRLPAPPTVIIGVEQGPWAPAKRGRVARLLLRTTPSGRDWRPLRAQLVAAGLEVQIIDRHTGQLL